MMRKHLLLLLLSIISIQFVSAQAALEGKVIDEANNEPVLFGDVVLYKDGVLITGTQTDFDGNYKIGSINPGTYDIQVSYVGYSIKQISGINLIEGKTQRVDIALAAGIDLEEIVVVEYKNPLIEQDNTSSGGTLTSKDIQNLPTKDLAGLVSLTAGTSSDGGGGISMRGSRTSGTDYYLDGIRISGASIPQSEIEQLTTLVGGIPASYGDVTGGVISLTSKGPSSKFAAGVEVETSEFLDAFGYNLVSANLSGPIIKNDKGQTVLGFRVSGQYTDRKEDGPSAIGRYAATEEYINQVEQNPIIEVGPEGNRFPVNEIDNAYLESNGGTIQLIDARENEGSTNYVTTAKIDLRLKNALDISISGNYNDTKNQFTPGGWGLFNWNRNPFATNQIYRGNFRLRHRLGSNGSVNQNDDAAQKISSIRNASYSITAGFQRSESQNEDRFHEDRLFDYGYIGDFQLDETPVFIPEFDPALGIVGALHIGNDQNLSSYTSGTQNPILARYNDLIDIDDPDFDEVTTYETFNGTRTTARATSYSIHNNVGSVYNNFSKSQGDRYTLDARVNFDFVPGSSNNGRHSFEFGFLYEQRVSKSWSVAPFGLWNIARRRQNEFIDGIDTAVVIRVDSFMGFPVNVHPNNVVTGADGNGFYSNIRKGLGLNQNDLVNVDGLRPDQLRLDWFSLDQLASEGAVSFFGYDYLGNELDASVTFDDFFAKDANGNQKFEVAAFRPNFIAAFVQDKFTYKDIIFRLGLRVERYDANTKVLKDPYSVYDIQTAKDFYPTNGERPAAVGDDFKVYVGPDESPRGVVGYREGEQWYDAAGTPVNDATTIFGAGGIVQPYYTNRDPESRDIKGTDFDVDGTFEDFEPEIKFSPRLSFSFPISDASNFYANYDILNQRPTSGVLNTALSYYYFIDNANSNGVNSNPNLKPVQTTQYEIGFNQKISNSSAVKIAAYYKEERDNIQRRTLQFVATPIGDYQTFDNIDFATTKGFSFTYDLRKTGNASLFANYTLAFADGTGSDANTQATLASSGFNVRTLSPLNFDERHKFNLTLDYRYGSGKKYNGPKLFGSDIFANAGVNFQTRAISGRPYTRRVTPVRFGGQGFAGGINAGRLPWQFSADMRIDKDFKLNRGAEGKRPLSFNVYLRIQNLFDAKNVVGVYTASGSADDDGYLASTFGLDEIDQVQESRKQFDDEANEFVDQYLARVHAPGAYALPRRIYLGAYFNF